MATNPYAAIAIKGDNPYASIAVKATPPAPTPVADDPWYSPVLTGLSDLVKAPFGSLATTPELVDLATGAGKGLLSTLSSTDNWARQHLPAVVTNSNMGFGKPADLAHVKAMATPTNTSQSLGKGLEQAGEFLVPGGAEEAGAAGLTKLAKLADLSPQASKFVPAAAKAVTAAGGGGLINGMQGGGVGTGMLMGGVGGAMGEGLKALAPGLAESSLSIQRGDRAYGRNPGVTLLNHTTGITPEGVASSAQGKLDDLVPQLDRLVNVTSYPVPVPRPNIRGFLPPPVEETLLHSSPDVMGDLSQPITLNQVDRPMMTALPAPRNVSSEFPLTSTLGHDPEMSPMAFNADKFPQANIVGGVGPQALRDLGSTAHTIPSRLTREAFMSGSEHPELSGELPVSQGILRRFEETVPGEVSGMGPGQYIGEIPGDRGGLGQPQGVLRRLPDMSSSTIPEGNPLFPQSQYPDLAPNNIASLRGARGIVSGAMDTATARNAEKEYNQLVPIRDFLARRFGTGEQIPEDITPSQLLDLKRGLGADHVHNWNPDVNKGVTDTAKQAYHSMAEELHRVVPGTADLDNTISNLIPVVRRAELANTSAGVTQRIADRIGRPTGGMLGAATGAFFGGPLGAVVGTVLPDLVSAPALKMAAARGMYSPITGQVLKPLIGAGLQQFDRDQQ
jgi:hypothetical protein